MGRSYLHKEKRRHNARDAAFRIGSALGFIPGAVGALHYGGKAKIKGIPVPTRALIAAGGALGSVAGGALGYGGTLAYQKASTIGERRKLTPGQIQKLKKIKRENAAGLGRTLGREAGYHASNVTTSALVPHGMFWPRYVANQASARAGGHAGEAAVKAAHKLRMKRKKKARDVKMREPKFKGKKSIRKCSEDAEFLISLGEQIYTYGFGANWYNPMMNTLSKIGQNSKPGGTLNKIGQSFAKGGSVRTAVGKATGAISRGFKKAKNFVKQKLGITKPTTPKTPKPPKAPGVPPPPKPTV